MNPVSPTADIAASAATMTTDDEDLLRWSELAEASSHVDPALYEEYAVKRGLRDVTGQGVRAGLTQIGEVIAYAADGDTLTPALGQLIYRGININDLVDGFVSEGRLGFEETSY